MLQGDADYVNASLVEVPEADRRYILTQGPLSNTLGDFWTMCWQQDSRGVVMLSRLFEKDTAKCHPYFPGGDEPGEILHLPVSYNPSFSLVSSRRMVFAFRF